MCARDCRLGVSPARPEGGGRLLAYRLKCEGAACPLSYVRTLPTGSLPSLPHHVSVRGSCPVSLPVLPRVTSRRVTSHEQQVTSRKYPVAEGLKHGAGRSVDHRVAGTGFPGLQHSRCPRRLGSGFHLCPVGQLPDPMGTAPTRYRSSPSRLTSSRPTLWEAGRRYRGYPPRDAPRESNPSEPLGMKKPASAGW